MQEEIQQCLPKRADINNNGENTRDHQSLELSAARLFPEGRVFASHKQLDQAMRHFSSAWAFQMTHPSTFIGCHYGAPVHKPRLHSDESKRRKLSHQPKLQVKCPFTIKYAPLGRPRKVADRLPKIHYRVKITHTCFQHTCGLNTRTHREARQRAGTNTPNIQGLQDIVAMLRQRPTLSCSTLRPFVEKHIPKFIVNF